MKQVITDILDAIAYVINGTPHDPKRFARKPPIGWHGAKETTMPENEWIQAKEGGFAVGYDGQMIYADGKTAAEQRAAKAAQERISLTEKEMGEMAVYRLSPTQKGLHNITMAIRIKKHWQEGKKPREIGLLVGCSESTARHYCLCFERANSSPI